MKTFLIWFIFGLISAGIGVYIALMGRNIHIRAIGMIVLIFTFFAPFIPLAIHENKIIELKKEKCKLMGGKWGVVSETWHGNGFSNNYGCIKKSK